MISNLALISLFDLWIKNIWEHQDCSQFANANGCREYTLGTLMNSYTLERAYSFLFLWVGKLKAIFM